MTIDGTGENTCDHTCQKKERGAYGGGERSTARVLTALPMGMDRYSHSYKLEAYEEKGRIRAHENRKYLSHEREEK